MKRYTITEGAKTTAGGVVIQASSLGSINGVRIALEGDLIFCKRCGAQGCIVCVGPRLKELWNGRQVGLENDLCACRCAPPPCLIASQTLRCQVIGESEAPSKESDPHAAGSLQDAVAALEALESYDLRFQLIDEASGLPAAGFAYRIDLANGASVEGRTGEDGMTDSVAAEQADMATLHVFEPEPAPINPHWDR